MTSTPEWGHQHSTDGRCPHVDGHRNTRLEAARRLLADTANTFEAVAREWLALQEKKLAPATFAKAVWTFETLVFPYIGSRPIAKLGSLRPPRHISTQLSISPLVQKATTSMHHVS